MYIEEVSFKEYQNIIKPYHVFANSEFSYINRHKCDSVFYLLFKNTKYRVGIIGGVKNGCFYSPFSAPYEGFSFIKNDVKISFIEDSLMELERWLQKKNITKIQITIPPLFYENKFIAKQLNVLFRYGYKTQSNDLNYYFDTSEFDDKYISKIWFTARNHLKNATKNNLSFFHCKNDLDKKEAYEVIKHNRKCKGFPLRMEFNDIAITDSVIKKDFFLLKTENNINIASAIIFYAKESEIAQVVYWGDNPEYSRLRPMNFLSYKLFEFYKTKNIKYIDIGTSSENSLPNYGLCEFKESIGCYIIPKYTFMKTI